MYIDGILFFFSMADPKAVTGRNNFLNRGPVYQCKLCIGDEKPYQGDHSQLVKHVVRDHLSEEEVPFSCGRCVKRRFLKESIKVTGPFKRETPKSQVTNKGYKATVHLKKRRREGSQ